MGFCSARSPDRARIETTFRRYSVGVISSSARSPDRARIETRRLGARSSYTEVAPGHQTGRGLKQACRFCRSENACVAPGHQTGRGLKLSLAVHRIQPSTRSARSPDRARIETPRQVDAVCPIACSARSPDRARIETYPLRNLTFRRVVAPGHQTGRGLKLSLAVHRIQPSTVAPGHQTGRGLKLDAFAASDILPR